MRDRKQIRLLIELTLLSFGKCKEIVKSDFLLFLHKVKVKEDRTTDFKESELKAKAGRVWLSWKSVGLIIPRS